MRIIVDILAFGLIVYVAGAAGFAVAKRFTERPRQLADLCLGLEVLRTEIVYAATPLATALGTLRVRAPLGEFFVHAAEGIASLKTARSAWEDALPVLVKQSALLGPDLAALRHLGEVLGTSNREDQERHLLVVLRRLESLQREAEEEAKRSATLWKYLGVLSGITLVIILI